MSGMVPGMDSKKMWAAALTKVMRDAGKDLIRSRPEYVVVLYPLNTAYGPVFMEETDGRIVTASSAAAAEKRAATMPMDHWQNVRVMTRDDASRAGAGLVNARENLSVTGQTVREATARPLATPRARASERRRPWVSAANWASVRACFAVAAGRRGQRAAAREMGVGRGSLSRWADDSSATFAGGSTDQYAMWAGRLIVSVVDAADTLPNFKLVKAAYAFGTIAARGSVASASSWAGVSRSAMSEWLSKASLPDAYQVDAVDPFGLWWPTVLPVVEIVAYALAEKRCNVCNKGTTETSLMLCGCGDPGGGTVIDLETAPMSWVETRCGWERAHARFTP